MNAPNDAVSATRGIFKLASTSDEMVTQDREADELRENRLDAELTAKRHPPERSEMAAGSSTDEQMDSVD